MKQSLEFQKIQEEMEKGRLSLEGFLGKDTRPLIDILLEDQEMVASLGLTHQRIADKLQELTQLALRTPLEWVPVTNELKIKAEEYRGQIPCPFHHPGLFLKNQTEARHKRVPRILFWSDLTIHLIREHGFYQGIGSIYRMDPREILHIIKDES